MAMTRRFEVVWWFNTINMYGDSRCGLGFYHQFSLYYKTELEAIEEIHTYLRTRTRARFDDISRSDNNVVL